MPARAPCDQVTTATRSLRALAEILTLSGAPIPRTTSHSVWPSATVPVVPGGGAPAPASVDAFASAGPAGGGLAGHAPSALTRSSAGTGVSGVSGGASIETFLMNSRPGRENHSASFDNRSDWNMLDAPEQPAIAGARTSNNASCFERSILNFTMY